MNPVAKHNILGIGTDRRNAMAKQNDRRSLAMFVSAMVIYGSIGIFRRYIPLSSSLLACFRGACGGLFLLLTELLRKRSTGEKQSMKQLLLLCVCGALMGVNWILLFEAYNYTTVSVATLCYYMEPTIVILLSPFLFQEPLTIRKGLCALTAVIGMFFVSGLVGSELPSSGDARGILLGLGAAVLYAAVVILNKRMPGVDAVRKTVIQLLSAAIVLLPYVVLTGQGSFAGLSGTGYLMLGIVGIVHTGIAYLLYFASMDGLKAQTVALFSYLDPVTALILSYLILQESLSVYGLIGAVLILGSAVLSELGGSDE